MATGTPVIAFRRGSVPEVIWDGLSGFIVDSVEEAVEAVGRVEGLDRSWVRRYFEERFTVERMVDQHLDVYLRLVAGGERRAVQAHRTMSVRSRRRPAWTPARQVHRPGTLPAIGHLPAALQGHAVLNGHAATNGHAGPGMGLDGLLVKNGHA